MRGELQNEEVEEECAKVMLHLILIDQSMKKFETMLMDSFFHKHNDRFRIRLWYPQRIDLL